ncbi:hypothetical protein B0J12DRAFT_643774 [Macrophomina phaseolina]|uniref:Secreted protein n=1 Tax=Macrophomina phaseolina TaxID=35725 RepID=A0ABQ8GTP2_9PEZI|nr:hypothetical protein B0J12DRAFT_643774 [Macrophomina phaseolina]
MGAARSLGSWTVLYVATGYALVAARSKHTLTMTLFSPPALHRLVIQSRVLATSAACPITDQAVLVCRSDGLLALPGACRDQIRTLRSLTSVTWHRR